MSDAPAGAAATGTQTPAPNGANGASTAPVNGAAPAKELSFDEELDALIQRRGGAKVKANGKEHVVKSAKDYNQYVSRGLGFQPLLEQTAKEKEEAAQVRRVAEVIQKGDPREVRQVLSQLRPDLRAIAESWVLEDYEAEQAKLKMSPGERQLREENERLKGERQQLTAQQQAAEERRQQEALNAEVGQLRERLGTTAQKALAAAKVSGVAAPVVMRAVVEQLSHAARVGAPPPDEAELTQAVTEAHGQIAGGWLSAAAQADPEAAFDMLENIKLPGKDSTGRPTETTFAQAMIEVAANRMRAKLSGAPGIRPAAPAAQTQQAKKEERPTLDARYWGKR